MADVATDWRVLVPVKVLEGEIIPDALIEFIAHLPVVILGYHEVPEQTPPGQARMQFEDQAQAVLDDLAADFQTAGEAAETRLVFTHDAEQTIDRVADETDSSAILLANPAPDIDRLLVPVREGAALERIARFVTDLVGDQPIDVTVFTVVPDADATEQGESLIADLARQLADGGIPEENIAQRFEQHTEPMQAITEAAIDADIVIMGESEPSLRTFLFGDSSERIAARSLGPVIVVRRISDPASSVEPTEAPE